MNMRLKIIIGSLLCFCWICGNGQVPDRIFSDRPVENWEHAMLSGNGEMGVILTAQNSISERQLMRFRPFKLSVCDNISFSWHQPAAGKTITKSRV